jgi:hypothetical protein
VSDAIRIGDCFPIRNFAKNQSPCNIRLLQQYRPLSAARTRSKSSMPFRRRTEVKSVTDLPVGA